MAITPLPRQVTAAVNIIFGPRIYYDAGRVAAMLRAFADGAPVNLFLPHDVLARRFGAAGGSKELAARLAVLANRLGIEAEVKERLAGGVPEGGELTIE